VNLGWKLAQVVDGMSPERLRTRTTPSAIRSPPVCCRGEGHPLLGRRMPDLDLATADGPVWVYTLLHDARPVLLNLGEPGGLRPLRVRRSRPSQIGQ
jgi:hypothetical protein